ncbi:MAG: DUF4926 domain-containing protein [Cyclobacteriaceae bacterium]
MKRENLKLLDTVAILKDVPEKKVVFGQVGTIVEELVEGVFEVEFANRFGETISEFAVKSEDLMLLHYEMELAK